ncbi:hypothetical protein MTR67_002041 [Solanum verrucosum]|uniref:NET domain-containing protein n=1 Tax=Solanum verrucosum TaxID=315347 RepID=A0AAF0PQ85_SOLVR|nr:hypothetical protein MTR67_002041 [Solanum verrucosum]
MASYTDGLNREHAELDSTVKPVISRVRDRIRINIVGATSRVEIRGIRSSGITAIPSGAVNSYSQPRYIDSDVMNSRALVRVNLEDRLPPESNKKLSQMALGGNTMTQHTSSEFTFKKLDAVVQIIKKRNSTFYQHDDEIEVDIDSVDAESFWELERFVTRIDSVEYQLSSHVHPLGQTHSNLLFTDVGPPFISVHAPVEA